MKKAVILLLVLLFSFGFTTYAEQDPLLTADESVDSVVSESIPDKIDYKWALEQYGKQEKIKLMEMNVDLNMPALEETLEKYEKMTDPIVGASSPMTRANNMVIMKYGIAEQKKSIEDLKNSVKAGLDREAISIRNSLRTLYASKLNIFYNEKNLYFAKKALDIAETFYRIGTQTYTEVLSARYSYLSAEDALEDATLAYENNLMSFNRYIGMDLLTEYKDFDLDEEPMIKNTDHIQKLADRKFEAIIKEKEYQIEKEQYRKESLESLILIYSHIEKDILEEVENIEERIADLEKELEQLHFYQRRQLNERAKSIIKAFEAIE
ncbi:MAG: TolC family protein, partial [Clostridiaceae bacterium]|nr:TolC family protein [Clostridiaceae bacterium]